MKFLKRIGAFFLLFTLVQVSFAQNEKDKLEALRVSFISKRVELSNSEAEKFWPVYNEYTDKLKAIKKNLRQNYHLKSENLSSREAEELYQLDLQSKQAELDIYRQYSDKIKAIIGVQKLVKLRVAEEQFKREMINSIKDRDN